MSENLFVQIDIVVQLFSMVLQNLWLQKCPHCESNYETKDSFILLPMPWLDLTNDDKNLLPSLTTVWVFVIFFVHTTG